MGYVNLFGKPGALFLALAAVPAILAQEPPTGGAKSGKTADQAISAAAVTASKQDPAAVERGGKAFTASCAGCHGAAANGGPGAPDLVRSLVVLDDEKGILIGPVIREGRPDKGMPKLGLSEQQIGDVVAWLHARTYAAGHRTTYVFQDVLTGDPRKGEAYFHAAGGCVSCHSTTGDLAGIGRKYDAFSLQGRWLQPRNSKSKASKNTSSVMPTVTVTLPDGRSVSGALEQMDDFTVALRDSHGQPHSFSREEKGVAVAVHDPLRGHADLLRKYTDADIHNVTAFLASLK